MKRDISRAQKIVDALLDSYLAAPPLRPSFDDPDTELDFYTRNPFTAWEHALQRGRHHPKLLAALKGSVYEPQYRKRFKLN